MASPAIVGWMPDSNMATQIAVPTTAAAAERPTGAKRRPMSTPKSPIAMASAVSETCSL